MIEFDLERAKNGEEFEILENGEWISIFNYCKDRDKHCEKGMSYKNIIKNLDISNSHVVVNDHWLNMVYIDHIRMKT